MVNTMIEGHRVQKSDSPERRAVRLSQLAENTGHPERLQPFPR